MAVRADRRNLFPALGASALLHACVIAGGLIVWPWGHRIVPVDVTPVTLMTSAELARLTAAEQADKPAPETTPEPDQTAEPAPPPAPEAAPTPKPPPAPPPQPKPEPKPEPTPAPEPAPAPKPSPKPVPEKPAKASAAAAQTPPAKPIDLDALARSLALNTKAAGPTAKSAAPKGPAKPAQDVSDRMQAGQARAASTTALSQIADKVTRLWNPNCGLEAAANVHIRVRMNLNQDGALTPGWPKLVDYANIDAITDPLVKASAIRAMTAVSRGAPYDNLPRDDYSFWKTVVLNFDAKSACGGA